MKNLETIIGIEIHLELNTKTKLFSSARNNFDSIPNTNASVIDLGYPGTLPSLNKEAVVKAIKLAKVLQMKIENELHFDRKNYYYTDIPKGFQITQQFRPIGSNGSLTLSLDKNNKKININRIHIEEDTARQIHNLEETLINYNRAGVPLIEIVSEPEINSADEAVNYIDSIRKIATFLDISDSKMSEGSLRADINISLRLLGDSSLGTKVEIKNLNSLNNVRKAIQYEIEYQTKKILLGEKIHQQTKRFDESTLENIVMREKNDGIDYKYFPEPNIPPILLSQKWIDEIQIDEMPWEKRERYLKDNIPNDYVSLLINNLEASKFFDSILIQDRVLLAKYFFAEILPLSKNLNFEDFKSKIKVNDIINLINLSIEGSISGKQLKTLFPKLINLNTTIDELIKKENSVQISDVAELTLLINNIIINNKNLIEEFQERPERCSKFILGQLMKITQGKANPIVASEITLKTLENYVKEK
ncbi:MAG: Asp-tRNA(Asn)/Glu-tRNA(Gln) amidotransferase subunit GatB [Mycoplasmataceae bacterium]|nr:Asp-tRNA(Asn)/Glu-tRNA(Gln) amidotransferase subunit GatB [Mycoplasmataceae bacterium]